jgi:putative phage-type endonuclease
MEQRSPEWFEARKSKVTGSIVGAILGINPWSTPDDAMRTMVRSHFGAESEFTGNIATEYGVMNEPNAITDLEITKGYDVEEVGFIVHPEHDWLGASPDGFILHDAVLEIKCPFGKRHDIDPNFTPAIDQPHYYAQTQIEMYCSEREWCYFYQWSPYGDKLESYKLDQHWIDENIPRLKAFHDQFLIECKDPEKYLAPLVKSVKADKLATAYNIAKSHLELAKKAVDDAKADLIAMADGKKCNISGLLVSPVEKKGAVSYAKAVKDLLPGANLEQYRGKSTSYWLIK